MIRIHKFTFNAFEENTYVVWDDTLQCAVIDPGCRSHSEREELVRFIGKADLVPKAILLTHMHPDHVFGVRELCDRYGAEVYMNQKETCPFGDVEKFDFTPADEGMTVTFGKLAAKALSTPGHSAGGLCWWFEEEKVIFTGDTLFRGCIGRSDLPGGDLDTLMDSLHNVLMNLDGDIDVLPGHGPASDIACERQTNPFLFTEEENVPEENF